MPEDRRNVALLAHQRDANARQAMVLQEIAAERDCLMRERNRFHEALDWVLHFEGDNPEATIAAVKAKARTAFGGQVTPHDHRTIVPGCYRCELGRDELLDITLTENAERGDVLYRAALVLFETDALGECGDIDDIDVPDVIVDQARSVLAERDRLRTIIADLYLQRSLDASGLRAAIRRAFGQSRPLEDH